MKLEEIRNNPEITENLRWDLTPEKLAIPKDAQFNPENAGYYFCIYQRGSKPCLVLLHYLTDGTATQDCIEGIPEEIILEALRDSDGKGEYHPINKPIEKLLRMGFYGYGANKNEVKEKACENLTKELKKIAMDFNRTVKSIEECGGMNETTTLSKMRVRQLLDRLMELLNKAHGGDYYNRFKEIAKERGRKVESSHFSRMDTVSIQLLIETLENAKAATIKMYPNKEAADEALAH